MDTGADERKLIYAHVLDQARLAMAFASQAGELPEGMSGMMLDVAEATRAQADSWRRQLTRTRKPRGGRGLPSRS